MQEVTTNPPLEGEGDPSSHAPLPTLSLGAMETLLTALDPLLAGFGEGPSCLDDAKAFLARLAQSSQENGDRDAETESEGMAEWIETWRMAGGNRATLRLFVQTLIAERRSTPNETGEE